MSVKRQEKLTELLKSKGIKEVYAYSRKSRDGDEREGLEKHRDILQEFADELGLPATILEEVGSSETLNRPVLNTLRQDIEKGSVRALLIYRLDRLTRKVTDLERLLQEFDFNDLILIEVNRGRIVDFKDTLGTKLESIMSDLYQEQSKIVLSAGRKKSVEIYGNHLGQAPLGYTYNKDTKKLEPNKDAWIIKLIYTTFIEQGGSHRRTCKKINLRGIRTGYGKGFSEQAVYLILKNEKYLGTQIYGRKQWFKNQDGYRKSKMRPREEWCIYENAHEAIIDRETFDKVQEIMEFNKTRKTGGRKKIQPLSQLVFCSKCGWSRGIHKRTLKDGTIRYDIKNCQHPHYATETACGDPSLRGEIIEDIVKRKIHQEVRPAFLKLKSKDSKDELKLKNQKPPQQVALELEQKNLDKQIERLIDIQLSGVAVERLANKLKTLESQLNYVNKRLKAFTDEDENETNDLKWVTKFLRETEDLNHFQLGWKGWTTEKKNIFFKKYVDKIIVGEREIKSIEWTQEVKTLLEL